MFDYILIKRSFTIDEISEILTKELFASNIGINYNNNTISCVINSREYKSHEYKFRIGYVDISSVFKVDVPEYTFAIGAVCYNKEKEVECLLKVIAKILFDKYKINSILLIQKYEYNNVFIIENNFNKSSYRSDINYKLYIDLLLDNHMMSIIYMDEFNQFEFKKHMEINTINIYIDTDDVVSKYNLIGIDINDYKIYRDLNNSHLLINFIHDGRYSITIDNISKELEYIMNVAILTEHITVGLLSECGNINNYNVTNIEVGNKYHIKHLRKTIKSKPTLGAGMVVRFQVLANKIDDEKLKNVLNNIYCYDVNILHNYYNLFNRVELDVLEFEIILVSGLNKRHYSNDLEYIISILKHNIQTEEDKFIYILYQFKPHIIYQTSYKNNLIVISEDDKSKQIFFKDVIKEKDMMEYVRDIIFGNYNVTYIECNGVLLELNNSDEEGNKN